MHNHLKFRLAHAREAEALRSSWTLRQIGESVMNRRKVQTWLLHKWVRADAREHGTVTMYDGSLSVRTVEE